MITIYMICWLSYTIGVWLSLPHKNHYSVCVIMMTRMPCEQNTKKKRLAVTSPSCDPLKKWSLAHDGDDSDPDPHVSPHRSNHHEDCTIHVLTWCDRHAAGWCREPWRGASWRFPTALTRPLTLMGWMFVMLLLVQIVIQLVFYKLYTSPPSGSRWAVFRTSVATRLASLLRDDLCKSSQDNSNSKHTPTK